MNKEVKWNSDSLYNLSELLVNSWYLSFRLDKLFGLEEFYFILFLDSLKASEGEPYLFFMLFEFDCWFLINWPSSFLILLSLYSSE